MNAAESEAKGHRPDRKLPNSPRLACSFSYDHASGAFFCHLSNGAVIPVEREHVAGKLANTLSLFRSQVIAMETGVRPKPAKPSLTTAAIAEALSRFDGPINRAGVVRVLKPARVTLEDLGL